MWLTSTLADFGLKHQHFYGSASDAGGDVKFMLCSDLQLRWEWCFAHMAHAATKIVVCAGRKKQQEANPEMAELITKMTQVITSVKLVSTAGDLLLNFVSRRQKEHLHVLSGIPLHAS
ncbi:hypothetical protein V7S43_011416 [Phytophthora oleae]|uniref:MULE transposase domain-containing protein n=1 Tax=Phytophthora oleae TaxID=2107226 RepID=A0ABD3FEV3_9STRA